MTGSKSAPQHGLSSRGWANVESIMPRISAQVAERKKKDNPAIDLGTAENWLIREELMEVCKDAVTCNLQPKHLSYARGFAGDPDLLEAYASFFNKYFDPVVQVDPSHLSTAPGAHGCLDALLFNICDAGEGVLVFGPYWNGFDFCFQARAAVTPVLVNLPDLESSFSPSALVAALDKAYRAAPCPVRALMITNPHNPLGQRYSRRCIVELARFCQEHDIHFISDEVYALTSFATDDDIVTQPFISALSLNTTAIGVDRHRIHTVWSLSKDLGQSGFRMGCIVTQQNQELAVGAALAANTQISALSTIFATALLTSPRLEPLISLNSLRLSEAYKKMTKFFKRYSIPYIPCYAGLYVFAKLDSESSTQSEKTSTVVEFKEAGVIVSSGQGYHCPEGVSGWARIGFAVPPNQLDEALMRMESVMERKREDAL